MKKYVAVMTALCIMSVSLFFHPELLVRAEETQKPDETSTVVLDKEADASYREHLERYVDAKRPIESISVSAEAFMIKGDKISPWKYR